MGFVRVALAFAALSTACFPAWAWAGVTTAKLTLAQRAPLVLVGSGFLAGERVSVTLTTGYGPRHARAVARNGRFRVVFRAPAKGCGAPWAARARGSRGSVATLKLSESSPCIPAPRR